MTISQLIDLASADQLIPFYTLTACVFAGIFIVHEVAMYFFDRWRARRNARRVISIDPERFKRAQ